MTPALTSWDNADVRGDEPGAAGAGLPDPPPPSPLEEVDDERFARHGLRLLLKRDDLLHPEVTGNKWRKLAPNLRAAAAGGHRTLLTFGGAYSGHLRATAAAGRMLGLATIGVVRGHELADRPLNDSLAGCVRDGMRLHFVTRAAYRRRADPAFAEELRARFGDFLALPEGGSNAAAVRGCAGLGQELARQLARTRGAGREGAAPGSDAAPGERGASGQGAGPADVAAVACGTGGTLAGLAAGLGQGRRALGIPVVGGGFLPGAVRSLQTAAFGGPRGDWRLDERFHHGGYARVPAPLARFAEDFALRHALPELDLTYVAKLLYALTSLAQEGAFPRGTTVAAVITGPGPGAEPGGELRPGVPELISDEAANRTHRMHYDE